MVDLPTGVIMRLMTANNQDMTMTYDEADRLGSGAEGTIYRCKCLDKLGNEYNELVVKAYEDDVIAKNLPAIIKQEKICDIMGYKFAVFKTEQENNIQHQYLVMPYLGKRIPMSFTPNKSFIEHFSESNEKTTENSSLRDIITSGNLITYIQSFQKITECVIGMHEKDIVHLDIKPQNILYNIDSNEFHLIDYGFSELLSDNLPIKTKGTPVFMAPELLDAFDDPCREKFSVYNDTYSLGKTFIYMLQNILKMVDKNLIVNGPTNEVKAKLGWAVYYKNDINLSNIYLNDKDYEQGIKVMNQILDILRDMVNLNQSLRPSLYHASNIFSDVVKQLSSLQQEQQIIDFREEVNELDFASELYEKEPKIQQKTQDKRFNLSPSFDSKKNNNIEKRVESKKLPDEEVIISKKTKKGEIGGGSL